MKVEEKKALERLQEVKEIVEGDATGERLIERTLEKASEYIGRVSSMERHLTLAKFRGIEGEILRDLTTRLDRSRRLAHDALISELFTANRYLFRNYADDMPVGGLFTLSPEAIHDRIAVGDWAGHLVGAIVANRPVEAVAA